MLWMIIESNIFFNILSGTVAGTLNHRTRKCARKVSRRLCIFTSIQSSIKYSNECTPLSSCVIHFVFYIYHFHYFQVPFIIDGCYQYITNNIFLRDWFIKHPLIIIYVDIECSASKCYIWGGFLKLPLTTVDPCTLERIDHL